MVLVVISSVLASVAVLLSAHRAFRMSKFNQEVEDFAQALISGASFATELDAIAKALAHIEASVDKNDVTAEGTVVDWQRLVVQAKSWNTSVARFSNKVSPDLKKIVDIKQTNAVRYFISYAAREEATKDALHLGLVAKHQMDLYRKVHVALSPKFDRCTTCASEMPDQCRPNWQRGSHVRWMNSGTQDVKRGRMDGKRIAVLSKSDHLIDT